MSTILITGGGRGLGRFTALALAQQGHHVIFTARNPAQGQAALEDFRRAAPKALVELRVLDLARLESVRAFAAQLNAQQVALDVLVNCAGIMQQSPQRRLTADGFEETLGVNVLAPVLLTRLLLPALAKAPAARVVNVSSRMHLPGSRGAPVAYDFGDPHLTAGYHPERAYKNSKLAMLWFTYELARRITPRTITVNAVCPGFVPATAAQVTHGVMRFIMRHVMPWMPFATSAAAATRSFVFMAVDPSLNGVTGTFYADLKPIPSSPESLDAAKAARFFDWAQQVTAAPAWPG